MVILDPDPDRKQGRQPEDSVDHLSVLICSSYYWPEASGNAPYVTGLAEYLKGCGHRVVVRTGFPHYPEWKSSANGRRSTRETHAGVEVHRRRHYVPPRQSAARRALYESSLFLGGLPGLGFFGHPDVVLGVSPSLAAASLALVAARMHNAPAGLIFQDLMGRAADESGVKGGESVAGVVRRLELGMARRATALGVVSDGFRAYFEAAGIAPARIFRVRNWNLTVPASLPRGEMRARLGWSDADFVCLYAGSMGHKQGLDNLLQAAAALRAHSVKVVLAGDGSDRGRLEALARSLQLDNVAFLGVQPSGDYEAMLLAADVLVVSQRPSVLDMALASKLTAYFAAGRPVIAAVAAGSETAREVVASQGGIVIPSASPNDLAAAILSLRTDPVRAGELAARGRRYALRHLSASSALAEYGRFVESLVNGRPRSTETMRMARSSA
jgi:glycosyltransferase involved in cell wall biosynthesis